MDNRKNAGSGMTDKGIAIKRWAYNTITYPYLLAVLSRAGLTGQGTVLAAAGLAGLYYSSSWTSKAIVSRSRTNISLTGPCKQSMDWQEKGLCRQQLY